MWKVELFNLSEILGLIILFVSCKTCNALEISFFWVQFWPYFYLISPIFCSTCISGISLCRMLSFNHDLVDPVTSHVEKCKNIDFALGGIELG